MSEFEVFLSACFQIVKMLLYARALITFNTTTETFNKMFLFYCFYLEI